MLSKGEKTMNMTVGFIGGGRVTRTILTGLKKADALPKDVAVYDPNPDALVLISKLFPEAACTDRMDIPASKDFVFLAVHPPVMIGVLSTLKDFLKDNTLIISLAPRWTIDAMSEKMGGYRRIVRMIPNAPSLVNAGYNPVAFSDAVGSDAKQAFREFVAKLGDSPEVAEQTIEAYAILTAMGLTYLWFQFLALQELGRSFGLSADDASAAIFRMVTGTAETLFESGLSPSEVLDLIPVTPLKHEEETIREIDRTNLQELYRKLTG
ncbi:MAG TPA: pyrroline-5-carboxylate reductase [Deltaproteobacteria bacterium]|nr:pyrroline-5-carboxylate reductase [Deltaproteobacteria bacterium]